MTCRSPLIHVEVDSMFNRSSIKTLLHLEPVGTKEPLHTSIPLELLFTAPVRWAQHLSQHEIRSHAQSSSELQRILPPPSRLGSENFQEWQLNHLLHDSLVPQRSKSWCNALESLNLTKNETTKPSEWERWEAELYKGVWTFQSAKRGSPTLGLEYLYSPPRYWPLWVKRVPRRLSAMPSRTVRVWIPTVKTRSQRLAELAVGPGEPSARTPWTIRLGPADCPQVGRGPSARSTELHPVLLGFEENNGPST
jgi:hypothetical protein